jgi:hypothetical protein
MRAAFGDMESTNGVDCRRWRRRNGFFSFV